MDRDLITAEAARRALPNGHLAGARAQVPLLYHENDSLEAFLDRTLLTVACDDGKSQSSSTIVTDRPYLIVSAPRTRPAALSVVR
jgi:hypothetical protein